MSNPTITGDSSNVNITNANLVVTNDIHANAFFDSSGTIVGAGGDGTTPTLQAVTDAGSTTTTVVTLDGGLVTSNILTEVFPTAGTLTLDMDNISYKTFTANVGSDITNLTVQNHIPGSQGIVYLTANATVTIQGVTSGLGGVGTVVGFDDIELLDTNTAILTFTSDGTNIFTNAGKYPPDAVESTSTSSNLHTVLENGNETSNTIIASLFQGDLVSSNIITEVFPSAGTLTLDMSNVSYKTFTANVGSDITTLTVQNHIPGSQGMVYLTANADVTIQGFTSGLGGTGVTVGFDDIELLDTNTAVLTFTSDGTNIFTNAAKYPAGDVQASLQDITDNGSTTTSAITMKEITVNTEKGASTESSGTLTVEQNSTSYQISNVSLSSDITALSWSNVVTGSQHACTVEASGDLTISNSLGADVKTSFSNVSVTSGNTAVMYMFYDGLKTYVNCIGYT